MKPDTENSIQEDLDAQQQYVQSHVDGHMRHLHLHILPGLEVAFRRGARKYQGAQHWQAPPQEVRNNEQDVEHVARCHVGVRLAEAEDLASTGDTGGCLAKIESAIGYLTVLHRRISER